MSKKMLEAALRYRQKYDLGVIPIIKGKKTPCLTQWKPYQDRKPTIEEIERWWGRDYPGANIGIVTGKINNLTVIDLDNPEAKQEIEKHLPDSFLTPSVKSPKGEHLYFSYQPEIPNKANLFPGCDSRNDGGYIIAPPSVNGTGHAYTYLVPLKNTALSPIPNTLLSYINSYLNARVAKDVPIIAENDLIFVEGGRDQTLFHLAHHLVQGSMPETNIRKFLHFFGSNCNPPFPVKELEIKIQSALNRKEKSQKSLIADVKEYALSSNDVFLSSDVVKDLGLSSRDDKKNLSKILGRLAEEKLIERHGQKRGTWRTIDRTITEQCWWESEGTPLPLEFPLGVEYFVKVFSGNIILLEGQKSQGKSAYALEFCRLNHHCFKGKALYQNVEMSDDELLERFQSYSGVHSIEEWRNNVMIIRQSANWWDKILSDGLNVVDYLVQYEEAYKIAQFVWEIHQKLKKGIALILVQRDPLKPYPRGGLGVRDIPRLILSLINHTLKLEDVKSFTKVMNGNPSGMVRKYKQANWWKFVPDGDWDYEEEKKYEKFKG